jgi:hypothetical protein
MLRYLLVFLVLASFQVEAQELWTAVTPSTAATARHESSFVSVGGKLYAVGGRGVRPVEEYDPQTNTWVKLADAPMEIHHFQAVSFQDELWIVGAMTGKYPHETPIPNILIFNPKTKAWREGPALPKILTKCTQSPRSCQCSSGRGQTVPRRGTYLLCQDW